MAIPYALYTLFEGTADFQLWSDGSVTNGSWLKPGSGIQFPDTTQLVSTSGLITSGQTGIFATLNNPNIFTQQNIFNNGIQISDGTYIYDSEHASKINVHLGQMFINGVATPQIDLGNNLLTDYTSNLTLSIDWKNRALYDTARNGIFNYYNLNALSFSGTIFYPITGFPSGKAVNIFPAIVLSNPNFASTGTPSQYSPALVFSGNAWASGLTFTGSQMNLGRLYLLPQSGVKSSSNLIYDYVIATGANGLITYTTGFQVSSNPNSGLQVYGNIYQSGNPVIALYNGNLVTSGNNQVLYGGTGIQISSSGNAISVSTYFNNQFNSGLQANTVCTNSFTYTNIISGNVGPGTWLMLANANVSTSAGGENVAFRAWAKVFSGSGAFCAAEAGCGALGAGISGLIALDLSAIVTTTASSTPIALAVAASIGNTQVLSAPTDTVAGGITNNPYSGSATYINMVRLY